MQVQFLGQEDPLEDSMATYSSILAQRIPWTEEPGGLQSMDHKELDTTKVTEHSTADLNFLWLEELPSWQSSHSDFAF